MVFESIVHTVMLQYLTWFVIGIAAGSGDIKSYTCGMHLVEVKVVPL
jgi:hypothetical protein